MSTFRSLGTLILTGTRSGRMLVTTFTDLAAMLLVSLASVICPSLSAVTSSVTSPFVMGKNPVNETIVLAPDARPFITFVSM